MLKLPQGNAICYSGYREGQSPNDKRYPSVAQIREDLHILKKNWQLLRLYDCSPHAASPVVIVVNDSRVLYPEILEGSGLDKASSARNSNTYSARSTCPTSW